LGYHIFLFRRKGNLPKNTGIATILFEKNVEKK